MRSLVFLSMVAVYWTVCVCHEEGDRRHDTIALFRGFLCYIREVPMDECKTDRTVSTMLRRLEGSDDATLESSHRYGAKPGVLGLPLPPQDARKRDAFYSDWRRR